MTWWCAAWNPATGMPSARSTAKESTPEPRRSPPRCHPPRSSTRNGYPDHRWVAEIDGRVEGWASLSPVSSRDCYRGVAENSIYIGSGARGRGVGKLLLRRQVQAADASEIWTVQSSIFPENRASVALHQAVGFRVVGTSLAYRSTGWAVA